MKKTRAPNCFLYRGWCPTQLYRDYFINPWSIRILSLNNQASMESKYLCEMGDLPHPSQHQRRRRQPRDEFLHSESLQERFLRQTILDHCPSFPAPPLHLPKSRVQEVRMVVLSHHWATKCQSQALEPVPKTKTSLMGRRYQECLHTSLRPTQEGRCVRLNLPVADLMRRGSPGGGDVSWT